MGWAGADKEAVKANALASMCIAYPMTYSWRGSYAVAESARRITYEATRKAQELWPGYDFPPFQDHQAPPTVSGWPEGEGEITISENELASRVEALRIINPDATQTIVSRLNGALGKVAIRLVRRGIPISTPDSMELLEGINWVLKNKHEPPMNKYVKSGIGFEWAGGDKNAAGMEDRYVKERDAIDLAESLITIYLGEVWADVESMGDLYSVFRFKKWVKNELFGSSGNPVYLTSVHRYKGAEADYIYLLRSLTVDEKPGNIFLLDHLMHKSPQTAQEEVCILYVAATRARVQNIQVVAEEEME